MLATTTIFYSNDWPKRLFSRLNKSAERPDESGRFLILKRSWHCVYDKHEEKKEDQVSTTEKKASKSSPRKTFYHKFFTVFTILYLAEQSFLPYSHFITKVIQN